MNNPATGEALLVETINPVWNVVSPTLNIYDYRDRIVHTLQKGDLILQVNIDGNGRKIYEIILLDAPALLYVLSRSPTKSAEGWVRFWVAGNEEFSVPSVQRVGGNPAWRIVSFNRHRRLLIPC